jgi:hypothetical protein
MLKQNAVTWGPKKSVVRHSLDLCIPKTTAENLLYKRLRLYAYRIQLQHDAYDTITPNRVRDENVMLNESDEVFLNRVPTTGILGIRVSIADTCHVVGAVHLHKYRTHLRSHRLSVDVTQVEEIVDTCLRSRDVSLTRIFYVLQAQT